MKDVMIDIETMGNTHNAALIQVAGVYFCRETGETGKEFVSSVNLQDCLDKGFTKDLSTEKWWQEQKQEVLEKILKSAQPLGDVIVKFNDFLSAGVEDVKYWSHATFDFPIVQNYFRKFDLPVLHFRSARDIRTLTDMAGVNPKDYDSVGDAHNALDDCKFQIKYCVDAMKRFKK